MFRLLSLAYVLTLEDGVKPTQYSQLRASQIHTLEPVVTKLMERTFDHDEKKVSSFATNLSLPCEVLNLIGGYCELG